MQMDKLEIQHIIQQISLLLMFWLIKIFKRQMKLRVVHGAMLMRAFIMNLFSLLTSNRGLLHYNPIIVFNIKWYLLTLLYVCAKGDNHWSLIVAQWCRMTIQMWVNIGLGNDFLLAARNQYPNHGWLFIGKVLCHSPESDFTASAQATLLNNEYENYPFNP